MFSSTDWLIITIIVVALIFLIGTGIYVYTEERDYRKEMKGKK